MSVALPVQTADEAYKDVLKFVGAIFPKRDATDERVIQEVKTKTATGMGVFGKPGIIDSPLAVGGWATYKNLPAAADTDNDGMPDDWEKKNGLNPSDAKDRNKTGSDGFTMLEKYLNELVMTK